MAHSALIVEQYVYHFLSQWHAGLQPSLRLDVQLNGSIAVSLNLTTPNVVRHEYHKSGRGARRRKRVRRGNFLGEGLWGSPPPKSVQIEFCANRLCTISAPNCAY